ncbi:MAG: DegT/DnrJ/EryC1/StrS family aminotransferase [Gammaproteobacteria bacterium]|nr:DegT/DnrJ/EryC1/StrS family aminotransferase [Gammaproteobacteria bacterium]
MAPREVLLPRLESVLYSGQIGEGDAVVDFEQRFGATIGNPHCLAFNSGTAALHTALILAGVGAGDEVITTAMTAEPTNLAILHAGAHPVWADVDPGNGNLNAGSIAACVSPRTRAILVVHYGGIPAPLGAINALAARYGLPVIEDAAHALGARYAGQAIGTHSDFVMFSFQAIKHMTTVDGGMLACRDPAVLARGRRVRWFGIDRAAPRTAVDVHEVGYKYHMNNVTATIGAIQLEYLPPLLARHIDNGRYFDRAFGAEAGLSPCLWDAAAAPSYWFYTVLADDRDGLARHLSAHGIANSLAHRRNDQHSVFRSSQRDLPGLDNFYAKMLHIPCGWWVDDEARAYITEVIARGW